MNEESTITARMSFGRSSPAHVLAGLLFLVALGGCGSGPESSAPERSDASREGVGFEASLDGMTVSELLVLGNQLLPEDEPAREEAVAKALKVLAALQSNGGEGVGRSVGDALELFASHTHRAVGELSRRRGDYEKALADYDRAASFLEPSRDLLQYSEILELKAIVDHERGALEDAVKRYARAAASYERLGNSEGALGGSRCRLGSATVLCEQGEFRQARSLLVAALEVFGELGFGPGVGTTYLQLGILGHLEGELVAAREDYEEAVRHFGEEPELQPGEAGVWTNLGEIDLAQGKPSQAIDRFRNSLVVHRDQDDAVWIGYDTLRLAEALAWQGELGEAVREFDSLDFETLESDPATRAEALLVGRHLDMARGRWSDAAEKADAAAESFSQGQRADDHARALVLAADVALLQGRFARSRGSYEAAAGRLEITQNRPLRWRGAAVAAQLEALDPGGLDAGLARLGELFDEVYEAGHVLLAAEIGLDHAEGALRAGDGARANYIMDALRNRYADSEFLAHIEQLWGAISESLSAP